MFWFWVKIFCCKNLLPAGKYFNVRWNIVLKYFVSCRKIFWIWNEILCWNILLRTMKMQQSGLGRPPINFAPLIHSLELDSRFWILFCWLFLELLSFVKTYDLHKKAITGLSKIIASLKGVQVSWDSCGGGKVVSQLSVVSLPLPKLNNFRVEFGFKFALKLELKYSIFTNSNGIAQNWVGLFKVQSFNDKMRRLGADGVKNGLILLAGIKERLQKVEAWFSSQTNWAIELRGVETINVFSPTKSTLLQEYLYKCMNCFCFKASA